MIVQAGLPSGNMDHVRASISSPDLQSLGGRFSGRSPVESF
jgi:hypothetical protein